MSQPTVDLSQLAVDRTSKEGPPQRSVRGRFVVRYLIPFTLIIAFLGLLVAAFGTSFLPKQDVQVVSVVVRRVESQSAGSPLFQAAGWIEPRPTSVGVPALAAGVVEELLVVEGQQVAKGDPVAKLIAIDAELAVQQAEATLAIREGELHRAEAELLAAKIRLEKPVHLKVQLADANSTLAKTLTELSKLPFLIEAAEAELEYARKSLAGKKSAGDAVPGLVVQQAESDLAVASAKLRELQRRGPNLQHEVDALQNKVDALQDQLALLVDENRQVQEADAKVRSATAIYNESKLRVQLAELALVRNVVRAPISGRILRIVAAPGTRVMGRDASAGPDASLVVEMYDPKRLQVRADVRLEDVPLVQPGQPVEIETASSSSVIMGRVLQTTSTANIQKNTLEVKVEMIEPPATVSPEMLVKTTFLAPQSASNGVKSDMAERIFVPRQLVKKDESGSFVWVVDANDRAHQRMITTGQVVEDDLIEATSGLNVTDKLIATNTGNIRAGTNLNVTGEENSIGVK